MIEGGGAKEGTVGGKVYDDETFDAGSLFGWGRGSGSPGHCHASFYEIRYWTRCMLRSVILIIDVYRRDGCNIISKRDAPLTLKLVIY